MGKLTYPPFIVLIALSASLFNASLAMNPSNLVRNGDFSERNIYGWVESSKLVSGALPPADAPHGYLELRVYGGYHGVHQDIRVQSLNLNFTFRVKVVSWATPTYAKPPLRVIGVWLFMYDSTGKRLGYLFYYYSPDATYKSTATAHKVKLGTGLPAPSGWTRVSVNVAREVSLYMPGVEPDEVYKVRIYAYVASFHTRVGGVYTTGYFDDFYLAPLST